MKIHEREVLVRAAELDVKNAVNEALGRHANLTFAETVRVFSASIADALGSLAKYEIRLERHGDDTKPGGLA